MIFGVRAVAEEFKEYLRLHINDFVDTKKASFEPYDVVKDGFRGEHGVPGTAIHIDMRKGEEYANPDDGAVALTENTDDHWIFSALWSSDDKDHPLSGNRWFGFTKVENRALCLWD